MNIKPLLPHSDVILYLGQDEKASVHVGRSVPLSDVTQQSFREIVGQYQIFITADHDWNYERVIPSVTLRMDTTQTYGKSLYSGGPNGICCIFVSVHNATTDASTGIKHIVNAYDTLIVISREASSAPSDQFIQPLTYHVHFETNDGFDHRGKTSTKPDCVSLSFLSWENGHSCGK